MPTENECRDISVELARHDERISALHHNIIDLFAKYDHISKDMIEIKTNILQMNSKIDIANKDQDARFEQLEAQFKQNLKLQTWVIGAVVSAIMFIFTNIESIKAFFHLLK